MSLSAYPSLFQINARQFLIKLSEKAGHPVTLDDIPDSEFDKVAKSGFDWIWMRFVWHTGKTGLKIPNENAENINERANGLQDLKEEYKDSGYSVSSYRVDDQLGGDAALSRLRKRMQDRGLKLMLDFVSNHSSIDHEWVTSFPDYYVRGNETLLTNEQANYIKIEGESGEIIFARGRDPLFPGWPGTLQFNYGNNALQEAMINELVKVSGQCDGVHCDMPMLILPGVFEDTWGIDSRPFWPVAIKKVKEFIPGFRFMSEVYWDQEGRLLQQQGFDYSYIINEDMMVEKRLWKISERTIVKESVIVRENNFDDLKTIPINYLIPKADA